MSKAIDRINTEVKFDYSQEKLGALTLIFLNILTYQDRKDVENPELSKAMKEGSAYLEAIKTFEPRMKEVKRIIAEEGDYYTAKFDLHLNRFVVIVITPKDKVA